MSVAMGILAQWRCSNAAAGMEDLFFAREAPGKKKEKRMNCVHEPEPQTPIMWRGHLYFRERVSEEAKVSYCRPD